MSSLKAQFGMRLRVLRRKRGITQEQFAGLADISVDFLSLIERGINAPSFQTLEKLALALELEVRDLFTFTE